MTQLKLDKIVQKTASKKRIHGTVFQVESDDNSINITSASGNITADGSFYIASINKIFLSAITLRLAQENKIKLSDKISKYLPPDIIKGLLVYKGVDYSDEITIEQLISHTSGLPCYLIDKRAEGQKVMEELLGGHDQEWPTEKVIAQVKKMKAKFYPGQKGKASYSNTNFRLVGNILETVMDRPLDSILNDLFSELEMKHTYVFGSNKDQKFIPPYSGEKPVFLPRYFASSKYDVISTAGDLMIFIKAFFNGYFFPKEKLPELEKWNHIFFPFKYGTGIQKFYTPRLFSPFMPIPDMIGHCGSTGTVAFYIPEKKVFVTGAVNQTKNPGLIFKTMIQIIQSL
ncbi:MAG: serine hydrolase domain-containing protein [Ginsengibacter sp.]